VEGRSSVGYNIHTLEEHARLYVHLHHGQNLLEGFDPGDTVLEVDKITPIKFEAAQNALNQVWSRQFC
jgi:hypothetical protein